MKVGLIQYKNKGSLDSNLAYVLREMKAGAAAGVQVFCVQELFLGRYFCQTEDQTNFDSAMTDDDEVIQQLRQLCAALNVVLVFSYFEKRAEGIYHNSALILDADGSVAGKYRKMHIPDDPGYYEKYYFTPGDLGFPSFKTKHGTIAVLICWDQWFSEAARLVALAGADVIFYPTAIGWDDGAYSELKTKELEAWKTVQKAHAISNGVFVVAVNRVGIEGALEFWGNSFVAQPDGTTVSLDAQQEETLIVELDETMIKNQRRTWPFLRDRRASDYNGLTKMFLK